MESPMCFFDGIIAFYYELRSDDRNIFRHISRRGYYFLGGALAAVLTGIVVFACLIDNKRSEIADFCTGLNSPVTANDVVFDEIFYSLRGVGNAKGLRIGYRIENENCDLNYAEWIPFGREPIMVWK